MGVPFIFRRRIAARSCSPSSPTSICAFMCACVSGLRAVNTLRYRRRGWRCQCRASVVMCTCVCDVHVHVHVCVQCEQSAPCTQSGGGHLFSIIYTWRSKRLRTGQRRGCEFVFKMTTRRK
jgi:hypothetical protein